MRTSRRTLLLLVALVLALLAYSLDNNSHGINCRSKAQILNEMCLALGIYARKVWIMPSSMYDTDCHVVNEVWDTALQKWVMLDVTNNQYWVDENEDFYLLFPENLHTEYDLFMSPASFEAAPA